MQSCRDQISVTVVLKTEPDCLSAVPPQVTQSLDVGQGLFGSPSAYRANRKELSESFSPSPSPSPERSIKCVIRPSPPTKRFSQATVNDFSIKALISPVIVGSGTCTSSMVSHEAPEIAIEDLEVQRSVEVPQ